MICHYSTQIEQLKTDDVLDDPAEGLDFFTGLSKAPSRVSCVLLPFTGLQKKHLVDPKNKEYVGCDRILLYNKRRGGIVMNVFEAAAEACRKGIAVAMATIIEASGSTPRSSGARMLVYAK